MGKRAKEKIKFATATPLDFMVITPPPPPHHYA